MELLQLRYFKELAEAEHLTNTAKKLMVSAPSLSMTISRLEHELGVTLFNHSGRNIYLNDSGRIFYIYVVKALNTIDKGVREAKEHSISASSVLNLAVASPLIWEDCLNVFRQTYPHIGLQVSIPDMKTMHENWTYDLFLGISREVDKDFFDYVYLTEEEKPVVLIPKANPLSDRKSLDFRELKEETFITLGKDSPTAHRFLLDMCFLAGFSLDKFIKATYFSRLKYLKENKGIILTTELGVKKNYVATEVFSVIPISFPLLTRHQTIAWEKDLPISEHGSLFKEFIIQYCKEYPLL